MKNRITAVLSCVALLLAMGTALAGKKDGGDTEENKIPYVSQVMVDESDVNLTTLYIWGSNFHVIADGVVVEDVTVTLPMGAPSATSTVSCDDLTMANCSIVAEFPYDVSAGDYLLTVSHAKGTIGYELTVGAVGLTGDQGPQGDKGDKGDTGGQGIQGLKGDQGDQGIQGVKGDKGDTGDQGVQGLKGDQGIQGIKGDQGDQGLKGDQGIQGELGPAGPPGQDSPGVETCPCAVAFGIAASNMYTGGNSDFPGEVCLPATGGYGLRIFHRGDRDSHIADFFVGDISAGDVQCTADFEVNWRNNSFKSANIAEAVTPGEAAACQALLVQIQAACPQ